MNSRLGCLKLVPNVKVGLGGDGPFFTLPSKSVLGSRVVDNPDTEGGRVRRNDVLAKSPDTLPFILCLVYGASVLSHFKDNSVET